MNITSTRRFKLVKEILDQAKKHKMPTGRLVSMIALLSDKALTKLHKEYIKKPI